MDEKEIAEELARERFIESAEVAMEIKASRCKDCEDCDCDMLHMPRGYQY